MRRRSPLAAICLLLLAVLAGGTWMVLREPGATDAERGSTEQATTSPTDPAATRERAEGARPQQPAGVTGRVRDSVTAAPAVGATVRVLAADDAVWEGTTDAAGAFRLTGVASGGALELYARHDAGSDAREVAALAAGELRDVGTLWLIRPARVDVQVLAPGGGPAAEARVRAHGRPRRAHGRIVRDLEATSDAAGVASFPHVPPGHWTFRADLPGTAPGTLRAVILGAGERRSFIVRLAPEYALTGRVTDADGVPLAGVRIAPHQAQRTWSVWGTRGDDVVTANDGTYRLTGLGSGRTTLFAGLPGAQLSTVGTIWIPSLERFDFVVRPGGTVVGRVRDHAGDPIVGARVAGGGRTAGGGTYSYAETDADGRYRLAGLLEATGVEVSATADGTLRARMQRGPFDLGRGETVTCDLVSPRGARISGTVRDADGPLPGASAFAWAPDRRLERASDTTDGSGRWSLTLPAPIRVVVAATHVGYHLRGAAPAHARPPIDQTAPERVLRLEPGDDVTLDLVLSRNVALRGRCEFEDGTPAAGVRLSWQPQEDRVLRARTEVVSGADGGFDFVAAVAGEEGWIQVAGGRFRLLDAAPVLRIEDASPIEGLVLRVAPAGPRRVVGTVRHADGRPAPEATVTAGPRRTVHPAPDGSFALELRSPRPRVQVEARLGERTDARTAVFAAGSDEAHVDLVLPSGHAVSGTVTSRGEPVAGAHVLVVPPNARFGGDAADAYAWREGVRFGATTDARGGFRIAGLAPGRVRIGALGHGLGLRVETVELPHSASLRLELEPLADLRGVVVDRNGRPVVGASVDCTPAKPTPAVQRHGLWGAHTTTDSVGRFVVRGLWPSPHRVSVRPGPHGSSFVPWTDAHGTAPGGEELRIIVDPAAIIGGTVVDRDGLPLAQREVRAYDGASGASLPAWTDDAGGFRISGLSGDSYLVVVEHRGSALATARDVTAGERSVRIIVAPDARIAGVLTSTDGNSAARRRVQAIPWTSGERGLRDVPPAAEATTTADGRFALGPMVAGRYRLCVLDREEDDVRIPLGPPEGVSAPATGIGVRLPPRHDLLIVVRDEHGAAVATGGLQLRHRPTGRWLNVDDGPPEGTLIRGLLAGEYEVQGWISRQGRLSEQLQFGTVRGEAGRVEVRPE